MAQQAKGANAQVVIQKEVSFKTVGAPDAQRLHFNSCGIRLSRAMESSEAIRANRNPGKPGRGNDDVSGPLVLELQAYMASLFEAVLGSKTTTGAGPYTHTFKVGTALPSYLIEKGFPDVGQYFKYSGCKASRLSMGITSSGFQKVTLDFMGAAEATAQAPFDATPTDLGKQSFDGFTLATIEEGGAAIAAVVSISGLTIDNGLDGDGYSLGSNGERDDIAEGTVKVTGTLNARFKDLVLYAKATAGTESSLKVLWQFGTGDGTAGNESIELLLPELVYVPNAPVINGPKGVLVELPFEAYYENSAVASAIQVIVKNTQAVI